MNSKLAAGDAAAFDELYREMADRLFHYLLMQTGSREDSADLIQESFVRLYQMRKNLASVENISAYVFKVTRNELMRWRSKNQRKVSSSCELFDVPIVSDSSTLDAHERVVKALLQIEDRYREVIELKTFANLTFAEISVAIGKPQGTIATWYRRGLAQLKDGLNNLSDG